MSSESYPESGVKLVADTVDYTDSMTAAIALADQFDAIGDITVTINADASEATTALEDLPLNDETVDYTVDVTQEGGDDLPMDGETVDYTVDTKVEAADDNSGGILDTLVAIKRNQQFKMALSIVGTAVDFFKGVGAFTVQPMIDLDNALARLKATTGQTIPDADKLINKIFYSDLGDSIDQVAKLVGQAHQLKAPMDEAVTSTLQFTKAFADQNPEQVLNTLNQLVITGLEPNFTKAGDDLTRAFQNGANKGGDLLDTLSKNAIAIKDLGLSADGALALVKSGLDAGFTSADEVIKTLEKIKQNVQGAAGNSKSKVSETLEKLDIANPAETGKAWSAEFFASVIKGIQEAPVSDSEKMVMFQNLVGGKLSSKEFSAFMKLSPEDAAGVFENTKGAAAAAADDIKGSLSGAIEDFERAAQGAAENFLSSKQIDLPGKISALKTGLQGALDVLGKGGTLSDALTIALKPIGFDDEFQGLESALGNFVIGILQAVAQIQDLTGHGDLAAGTRGAVSQLAEKQLTFDLKVGNPDAVATTIATAVSRGVAPDAIAESVSKVVTDLIKQGMPDAAKSILDNLGKAGDIGLKVDPGFGAAAKTEITTLLNAAGAGKLNSDGTISLAFTPGMSDDAKTKMADQVKDIIDSDFGQEAVTKFNVTPTIPQEQYAALQNEVNKHLGLEKEAAIAAVKDASLSNETLTKKLLADKQTAISDIKDASLTMGNTLTPKVSDLSTATHHAATTVTEQSKATEGLGYNVVIATNGLHSMIDAISVLNATAEKLKSENNDMATRNGAAGGSVGVQADTGKHAAGGSFIGTGIVGDAGPEVVSSDTGLSVLNNATTERLMAALQSYIPGGNFGGKGNVSNTIINQNNIPNIATADALGYKQAATLRGMSGS